MSAPTRGGGSQRAGRGGGIANNTQSSQRGRGTARAGSNASTRGGRGRGRGTTNATTGAATSGAEGLLQKIRSGTIKRGTGDNGGSPTITRGRGNAAKGTTTSLRGRARGRGGLSQTFGDQSRPSSSDSRPSSPAPASTSQRDFMNDAIAKFQVLKQNRDAERAHAIRDGFLADPDKKTSLDKAITPVGTCTEMCPEFERIERIVQNMVDRAEKTQDGNAGRDIPAEDRMVKRFRRSAAGYDEQLPSDIRTPETLKRTLDYLLDKVVEGGERFASIHKFVWDRTRGIRNDFSIQQVTKPEDVRIAVECYERIARFHILSLHQLANPDNLQEGEHFDVFQEREQLNNTLLSLIYYYEDHRQSTPFPNEGEFRAYCILFELQSQHPDLEDRMQAWPKDLLADRRVQTAFTLYCAAGNTLFDQGPLRPSAPFLVAQGNGGTFWSILSSKAVSYVMACVAELHFGQVRFTALDAIWRAGKSAPQAQQTKSQDWTIAELTSFLCFDTDDQTAEFCAAFSLAFSVNEHNERYLDFTALTDISLDKSSIPSQQVFSHSVVEEKRYRRSLVAIVNGIPAAQAIRQGLVESEDGAEVEHDDTMSGDDHSMFIPEQTVTAQPKPSSTAFSFNPEATAFSSKFGESTASSIFSGFGQTTSLNSSTFPATSLISQKGIQEPSMPVTGFAGAQSLNTNSDSIKVPSTSQFRPNPFSSTFKDSTSSSGGHGSTLKAPAPTFKFGEPSHQFSTTTSPPATASAAPKQPAATGFLFPAATSTLVPATTAISSSLPPSWNFSGPSQPSSSSQQPQDLTHSKSELSTPSLVQSSEMQSTASKAVNNFGLTQKPASTGTQFPAATSPTPTQQFPNPNSSFLKFDQIPQTSVIPPSQSKETISQQPAADYRPTFPTFNLPPQLPSTSLKATPSPPSSVGSFSFLPATGPESRTTELPKPKSRSTTPPSSPPRQASAPILTEGDKRNLVGIAAELALRQPHGLIQQYLEYSLSGTLQNLVQQYQTEVFNAALSSIKERILARKFGLLWRSLTWQKNLNKRARHRRHLIAETIKMDEMSRKRRVGELEEIVQAGRDKKRIQEEQKNSDTKQAREIDFHTSIRASDETSTIARKRKSLSEHEGSREKIVREPKAHKRSRTVGHSDLSAPTMANPRGQSVTGFKTSVFSGPPANLGRSTANSHLRLSQAIQKVDTTHTDYFRLKALGIDSDLPLRSKTFRKTVENTKPGHSTRSSPCVTLSGTTTTQTTPPKVIARAQPTEQSQATSIVTLPAKPPSRSDTDDDFLKQLRQARAALADDVRWFRSQTTVLEAEADAREKAEQTRQQQVARVQLSPRVSTDGLAKVNGYDYRPSGNPSGHTLSATELRIRRTGAHGLATKPVGILSDYIPVAMSKRSAARYSDISVTSTAPSWVDEIAGESGSSQQQKQSSPRNNRVKSATSHPKQVSGIADLDKIDPRLSTGGRGRDGPSRTQNRSRNAYELLQSVSDEDNGGEEYPQGQYVNGQDHSHPEDEDDGDGTDEEEYYYTKPQLQRQARHEQNIQDEPEDFIKDDGYDEEEDPEDDDEEDHPFEYEYEEEDDEEDEDEDEEDSDHVHNHHIRAEGGRFLDASAAIRSSFQRQNTSSSNDTTSNGAGGTGTGVSSRAISTGPGASVDDALVLSDSD